MAPSQHQANSWEFEESLSSGSDLRVVPSASLPDLTAVSSHVLPKGAQHLDSDGHLEIPLLSNFLALKGGKKIVLNSNSFSWDFSLDPQARWHMVKYIAAPVYGSSKFLPSQIHSLINVCGHFWPVYFTVPDFLPIQTALCPLGIIICRQSSANCRRT